jgi:hypothetical protein
VVVVGEAVGEVTVGTLVVGEDVVGETVVGKDVVGETIVGETVVGETVVGDAVVGDTVGEAVLNVTMGSLTVTVPKVSTPLTAANTSAGLADLSLATNWSAFACSLASNVINVSTTTLPATMDRISTCNAVRHHECEKVGHANTRDGDSNRSISICMWSHLGPLDHKVEWIIGNRP